MSGEGTASFKKKTVQNILQQFFRDEKTKVNSEAVALLTELLRIFVSEAALRSCKEAQKDYSETVDVEHFEKILPQLLMDF